jgi:predicted small lipoprotein YifL
MKNYFKFKFLVLLMALFSLNYCEELFDDGD